METREGSPREHAAGRVRAGSCPGTGFLPHFRYQLGCRISVFWHKVLFLGLIRRGKMAGDTWGWERTPFFLFDTDINGRSRLPGKYIWVQDSGVKFYFLIQILDIQWYIAWTETVPSSPLGKQSWWLSLFKFLLSKFYLHDNAVKLGWLLAPELGNLWHR